MSDTIQTDIKHEGTLTQAFNLYGDPDRAPRKTPGQQQDAAPASALSNQDHDDSAVSAVHDRQREFDKETIELSRHDDPSALAGRMSIIGVNIREAIKAAKRRKEDFVKLLTQQSMEDIAKSVAEAREKVKQAADALQKEKEEALDRIQESTEKIDNAMDAIKNGRTQRDGNGNFIDPSLHVILLDYCARNNLPLDAVAAYSDDAVMDVINEEIQNKKDDISKDTNIVDAIDNIMPILEELDADLTEIEKILRSDAPEEIKKQQLADALQDVELDDLVKAVDQLDDAGVKGETVDLLRVVVKEVRNQDAIKTMNNIQAPSPDGLLGGL